jgi:hypothetical protein
MTDNVFGAYVDFVQGESTPPIDAPAVDVGTRVRLLDACANEPGTPETTPAERFAKKSIRRYLLGGGRISLEQAFEIETRPSARSAPRVFLQTQYEQALLEAWNSLQGRKLNDEKPFQWADLKRFLSEIAEFETLCWMPWQKSGMPKNASRMQANLYLACELATSLHSEAVIEKGSLHPKSLEGMRRLLNRAASLN